MKSSRPILAAWLLERLTQRQNREALAGDLLEERSQGRSDMGIAVMSAFQAAILLAWIPMLGN